MEKIVKIQKDGKVQVTVADERFYFDTDGTVVPSVTWIASYYPKGIEFYKYLAAKGWDEAEEIKALAGDKGTRVHNAIENVIQGKVVNINDSYLSQVTGKEEPLSPEECDCILSAQHFLEEMNPKVYLVEKTVINKAEGYAGTIDIVCEIGGELGILDIKTSQSIWKSHMLQLPAYKKAFPGIVGKKIIAGQEVPFIERPIEKLWILQVGYKRNKDRWKLTEIADRYDLFLYAKGIWTEEAGKVEPKRYEFPEQFSWKYEEAPAVAEQPVQESPKKKTIKKTI